MGTYGEKRIGKGLFMDKARGALKEPMDGGVRTALDYRVEKDDGILALTGTESAVV